MAVAGCCAQAAIAAAETLLYVLRSAAQPTLYSSYRLKSDGFFIWVRMKKPRELKKNLERERERCA
jgi:hypothetical protein